MSQGINVDVNDLETCICECGSKVWVEALVIKRASKLLIGQDEDQYMKVPLAACIKCGELMPNQVDMKI